MLIIDHRKYRYCPNKVINIFIINKYTRENHPFFFSFSFFLARILYETVTIFIIESTMIYISIFVALLVGYLTYKWLIYPFYLSPLKNLPGPPLDYFLLGNFIKIVIKSEVNGRSKILFERLI